MAEGPIGPGEAERHVWRRPSAVAGVTEPDRPLVATVSNLSLRIFTPRPLHRRLRDV